MGGYLPDERRARVQTWYSLNLRRVEDPLEPTGSGGPPRLRAWGKREAPKAPAPDRGEARRSRPKAGHPIPDPINTTAEPGTGPTQLSSFFSGQQR